MYNKGHAACSINDNRNTLNEKEEAPNGDLLFSLMLYIFRGVVC